MAISRSNINILAIIKFLLTIHGHFVDLSRVILLDISQDPDVVIFDKVDGHTFATKTSRTTDTMNVQLTIVRQIVVDNQWDLQKKTQSANQDKTKWNIELTLKVREMCFENGLGFLEIRASTTNWDNKNIQTW